MFNGDKMIFRHNTDSTTPEELFVIPVKERCENSLVGGKAFHISQLARKGVAVPEGFCITTRAYDYFAAYNNIVQPDSSTVQKGIMPPELSEAIMAAYRTYIHRSCAVRSSSPLEDLSRASFAGQYKSVLHVEGDALLDAVKECWASLWSRSAVEYRKKMGMNHKKVTMAVLVQEMVAAEASGVLFVQDEMVVEAVWGLGDLLVGGRTVPDHWVVNREIEERNIAHKPVMSQMGDTGVEVVDVPEHLQDAPVLDDSQVYALCTLGKKVKAFFGCPQDIEWTLSGSEFVLLQSRPITVEEPVIWSRANAAETIPGYTTYLSRVPENKPDDIVLGLLPLLERFGIKENPETLRFKEYIYGYVYLNMTVVSRVLGKIPGLSPEILYQSLGHTTEKEAPAPTLGVSAVVSLLPGTVRVIHFFLNLPKKAHQVIPYSVKLIEDIRQKNVEELSLEELEELIWDMYERNSHVFQVHAVTALAVFALFGIVQKMVARAGEKGMEHMLTAGLDGMSSSQLGVQMWKLAACAQQWPDVADLIRSKKENALYELKSSEEGTAFVREFDAFIRKYGDRCSRELELSTPRWEENPQFVLSMVAHYLDSPVDPLETMKAQKRMRVKAEQQIYKKMNFFERLIFRILLKKTEQYIVTRENLKTTWMRGISALKTLYMAIAAHLVEKGILACTDDIFYLKMTEVSDIITGRLKKEEFTNWIPERREEKEECEHIQMPEVIIGNPPPIEELTYTGEPEDTLEGKGCSPGVITGRAAVLCDAAECGEFHQGDILVAPVTDPGWSPLFVTAGGLVMELGGTLSHGVIIAREYGIPAVVGVKHATQIIRTGDIITVDGNTGLVQVRRSDEN
jgi:pyruvate,water dikinase